MLLTTSLLLGSFRERAQEIDVRPWTSKEKEARLQNELQSSKYRFTCASQTEMPQLAIT